MNQETDAGTALEPLPSNKLQMGGDLTEMVQVAQLMAKARVALPAHLHNSPGECLAIVMQSRDWNMNPFAVGQKTSIINGRLMYEGQLVQAAVNNARILAERFDYKFEGAGEQLTCTATARIKGDKEVKSVTIGMPKATEARNSPLWKSNPEQQLTYKATRVWVRRYAPEIMLGVYTPEDDWAEREPMVVDEPSAINNRVAQLGVTAPEKIVGDPFAADGVTIDVSNMIGSPVAASVTPMTNEKGDAVYAQRPISAAVSATGAGISRNDVAVGNPTIGIGTVSGAELENMAQLDDIPEHFRGQPITATQVLNRHAGRCDECGNEGIDGGCPSCGRGNE